MHQEVINILIYLHFNWLILQKEFFLKKNNRKIIKRELIEVNLIYIPFSSNSPKIASLSYKYQKISFSSISKRKIYFYLSILAKVLMIYFF